MRARFVTWFAIEPLKSPVDQPVANELYTVNVLFMVTRKIICATFLLLLCPLILGLQTANGALPKYYKEKRAFYDSLSIVLNKYIVPVGNWGLFEGTLQGLQSHIGADQMGLNSAHSQVEVTIKNSPTLLFSKDKIALLYDGIKITGRHIFPVLFKFHVSSHMENPFLHRSA